MKAGTSKVLKTVAFFLLFPLTEVHSWGQRFVVVHPQRIPSPLVLLPFISPPCYHHLAVSSLPTQEPFLIGEVFKYVHIFVKYAVLLFVPMDFHMCVYCPSILLLLFSVQFSSVAQSCLTLCDPTNCSTPGFPVHHQLPEFSQTHVHRVTDAIQPSHPRSPPFPPALNPSQHQSLFQSSLRMRWPEYWSFSFSIITSIETTYRKEHKPKVFSARVV